MRETYRRRLDRAEKTAEAGSADKFLPLSALKIYEHRQRRRTKQHPFKMETVLIETILNASRSIRAVEGAVGRRQPAAKAGSIE